MTLQHWHSAGLIEEARGALMKIVVVALIATLAAVSVSGCAGMGKGKGKAPPPVVTKG